MKQVPSVLSYISPVSFPALKYAPPVSFHNISPVSKRTLSIISWEGIP